MYLRPIWGAAFVALLLSTSALAEEPKEPPKQPSQAKELRVTLQLPPASMQAKNLSLFKQQVETLSKGTLRISIVPSGQLVEDSQVIKAVVTGQVEIGASRIGHFTEADAAAPRAIARTIAGEPALTAIGKAQRRPEHHAKLSRRRSPR